MKRIRRVPSMPPPLAGTQLHDHLLAVAQAHEASGMFMAVLAIRLFCASVPRLDYRPDIDAQLQEHAMRTLGSMLRADDRAVAIGPREIIAVLTGLRSPEFAELGAARLVASYRDPVSINGAYEQVRITVGIAVGSPDATRPEALVRHARVAAREAQTETASYRVHAPVSAAADDGPVENDLRAAMAANAFDLAFQPQVRLDGGAPVAVEVLARWTDSNGRAVPPDVYIPLAERCGLLPRFTQWVLHSALRQHRQFLDDGLQVSVAINLSAVDLRERDFCEMVEDTLHTWSVPADRITLELTETAPVHDPGEVVPRLERLKRIGVRLSIDDFGTGYSSLSLLRQLPVDQVKIDQQFIRGLLESRQKMDIVRTTLALAANFGLGTVAEGIEDEATLSVLRDMGCELGQGYGIARPLTAEAVARWLRDRCCQPLPLPT